MDFVCKKYEEFYKKHGYVPSLFNPYNCAEIKDIAPCVTTNCGGTGCSATVLIMEGVPLREEENND